MTNINTPLSEIAHLLPVEQAGRLALTPPEIQMAVLIDVRMIIHRWEQSGVDLDPITFSKVIGPLVDSLLISAVALQVALLGEKSMKIGE